MVVGGLIDLMAGLRGTRDERLATVIWGMASAILGILALSWPDVTVLVVAAGWLWHALRATSLRDDEAVVEAVF